MATHGFDGVDIALEFPDEDVPEDKAALTTLLEVCSDFRRKKRGEFFIFSGNSKTETTDVTINCYFNSGTIR
jgi:chitinase